MNRISRITASALIALAMAGCASAAETAQKAVDAYNSTLSDYNTGSAEYTAAVDQINQENADLEKALDDAQESLNGEDQPFESDMTGKLKDAITSAENVRIKEPEELPKYEELTVDANADSDALKALTKQANDDAKAISAIEIPSEIPDVPDISEEINNLKTATEQYDDSVQSLRQITAPSDEFVMDRLRRVDTITAMDHVTEDHDPNNSLNKQGGYIGTVYFTDSEVDRSAHYITETDIIDVGTQGGGSVEIYPDVDSANARDSYLGAFDGTGMFNSGSHYVYGTCVIRTSEYLTASQQTELTQKIVNALTAID